MKQIWYIFLVIMVPLFWLSLYEAKAHIVTEGRSTQSLLVLWKDKVQISFNIGFSTNEGYNELVRAIDRNSDQQISDEEKDLYIKFLGDYVVSHLSLYVDGKKIPIRFTGIREKDTTLSTGKISDLTWALGLWFELEAPLKNTPPAKWHILDYQDTTFTDPGITSIPTGHVSYNQQVKSVKTPHARNLIKGPEAYIIYGRGITIEYSLTETLGGYSGVGTARCGKAFIRFSSISY